MSSIGTINLPRVGSAAVTRYGLVPDPTITASTSVLVYRLQDSLYFSMPFIAGNFVYYYRQVTGGVEIGVYNNATGNDPGAETFNYKYLVLSDAAATMLRAGGVDLANYNDVRRYLDRIR